MNGNKDDKPKDMEEVTTKQVEKRDRSKTKVLLYLLFKLEHYFRFT